MWYLDVCHLTAELCEKVNSSYRQQFYARPATDCTQIASFPFNLKIISHISQVYYFHITFYSVYENLEPRYYMYPCHADKEQQKQLSVPSTAQGYKVNSLYHCHLWAYSAFNPLTHKSAMWHKRPLHAYNVHVQVFAIFPSYTFKAKLISHNNPHLKTHKLSHSLREYHD